MDLSDSLALFGRRYTRTKAPRSGGRRFTLRDLLETFDQNAILELTQYERGKPVSTLRPDARRKLKVSLLDDGVAPIHSGPDDWYEVYRTAPTGDLSKVRIVARSPDDRQIGELRLLLGRRTMEHYFRDDPLVLPGEGNRDGPN
jgi:hypothetical protein